MAKLICTQCLYEGRDQSNESVTDFRQIAVVDGDSLCKAHAERALKARRAEGIAAAEDQPRATRRNEWAAPAPVGSAAGSPKSSSHDG